MKCRKCRGEIPDGSKFCLFCGCNQEIRQNTKKRGNGQGSVYQLPNKTWIAVKTVAYEELENGKIRHIKRSKSGFKTKKEALAHLPQLKREKSIKLKTWTEIYDAWLPTHKAGKSTMDCYKAANKYFCQVWYQKFAEITIDDLQECMDECEKGKRTRENMKTLAGLLYKYAIPRHQANLNIAQYLIVGGGETGEKEGLPENAVKRIAENVNIIKGADYVLCQCYLGFRPSEFLALDVKNYNREERAFVGGAKTATGKNRIVTVSPKIQPIIDRLVKDKLSGPVFCTDVGTAMNIKAYRELFYSVLEKCGIDNPIIEVAGIKRRKYTPHSCRHTFATLLKRVKAADADKLKLIGHTSTEMLRHYQDVSFEDLRKVTNAI